MLEGLGRHAGAILGATPLYDFVTQLAAFDSPIATFLDEEIREQKNYPMVCQSLQSVAARLKFDWNAGTPYRDLFKPRLFDFWDRLDRTGGAVPDEDPWYISRARFGSDVPLEYAYAAWGDLPAPATGSTAGPVRRLRRVSPQHAGPAARVRDPAAGGDGVDRAASSRATRSRRRGRSICRTSTSSRRRRRTWPAPSTSS